MKTITKTFDVYTYDELTPEAQKKALQTYNEAIEYPFLQADMRVFIQDELTNAGYTFGEITPLYSLSYSQGDGLMFEGNITDKDGNTYTIKHSGHYYHERSTDISATNADGEELTDEQIKEWEENFYIPLCKNARDYGYSTIEYLESEEYFAEMCDSCEMLFTKDGTLYE